MADRIGEESVEANKEALERILKGQPLPLIMDDLRRQDYSERTIDLAINSAYQFCIEEANPDLKIEFGKALIRLEMLFSKNINNEDYKAALAVQIERHKLLRMHPSKPKAAAPPRTVDPESSIVATIISKYEA